MKKHVVRISTAVFLAMLCLTQASMATAKYSVSENKEAVIVPVKEYVIVTSYSVYADTPCTHKVNGVVWVTETITGFVGETCYYTEYGYIKTCNICEEIIEGGTKQYLKDPPDHVYKTYLTSTNTYHTYEKRCEKCNEALESQTDPHEFIDVLTSCNGTTHTYQTYCSKCRFILKTWTTRCKPPCDFHLTSIGEDMGTVSVW